LSAIQQSKRAPAPSPESFMSEQLSFFQNSTFRCNSEDARRASSNSIGMWNIIPKYSISQQTMSKMRNADGFLGSLSIPFTYKQIELKLIIKPALVFEKDSDGVEKEVAYYPSSNEELVEEVLLKFASEQCVGFHETNKNSGVVFTVNQIRKELKKYNKTRSHEQIVKSLNILSGSTLEIVGEKDNEKYGTRSAYFPLVSWVGKADLHSDPHARWHIHFHSMVTKSIDCLDYRQFNYEKLMSHKTSLARWLHKYLIEKYTMANHSQGKEFRIRYSTIKRDSAMLNGFSIEGNAFAACKIAIKELEVQKIVNSVVYEMIYDPTNKNKIQDIVYILTPTDEFIREVAAANTRKSDALKNIQKK
jgi:hypothetical protein